MDYKKLTVFYEAVWLTSEGNIVHLSHVPWRKPALTKRDQQIGIGKSTASRCLLQILSPPCFLVDTLTSTTTEWKIQQCYFSAPSLYFKATSSNQVILIDSIELCKTKNSSQLLSQQKMLAYLKKKHNYLTELPYYYVDSMKLFSILSLLHSQ